MIFEEAKLRRSVKVVNVRPYAQVKQEQVGWKVAKDSWVELG
jgi:hypothetical protein